VRYYLTLTDRKGMTKNLGRRGHIITEIGRKELEVAIAIDKVGFVNSRIDKLTYQMNFDDNSMDGTVILNISTINTSDTDYVLDLITRVIHAKLGMGRYVRINSSSQMIQNIKVPDNHTTIGTICSVTINGILLSHGISMTSRFGGLLELSDGIPVRFSQIINYNGSTLDPLEIFIKSKMTSVVRAVSTGTGSIGASFREIPIAALSATKDLLERLEKIGLGGVLMMGKPNQPLLDIPVTTGHVGLIVAGGLNPIAALEESGTVTVNSSLHELCDFQQLQTI
ncbi:MAG: DUF128 domain-containing protein, partial [Sedimentisphaerales bacterium]|nr:DUF128 domain-containing protein [Sedimentisphaerales bacterium]